jgi:hypothetical protein
MADEDAKRRIPFAFLDDIKVWQTFILQRDGAVLLLRVCRMNELSACAQNRFKSTYGNRAMTAIAFAMNEEFSPVLKKQLVAN